MNEYNDRVVSLLHKRISGVDLTVTEEEELDAWVAASVHNRDLYHELTQTDMLQRELKEMLNYDSKALWKKVSSRMEPEKGVKGFFSIFRHRPFFRYAAAAVLFIFISITAYLLIVKSSKPGRPEVAVTPVAAKPDLAPGKEMATLTLADGTVMQLDNTANGKIAEQSNAVVVKEDGLLAYNADPQKRTSELVYNTVRTARGQQFSSLVLADGSKIWLNSSSSIKFPVSFTGKKREVEVTGEAYFEVAKNAAMPFIVTVKGMQVQVLGTHFNVNTYEDEAMIKTSLLEGSVKLIAGGKETLLKPGQQGSLGVNGVIKLSSNVNMDEVVAWKNGRFMFMNEDISTIMRQVSRWYNVDIVFEENVTERYVVTNLPRNVAVSKLLEIFEKAGGVHFRVDDVTKKIYVRR